MTFKQILQGFISLVSSDDTAYPQGQAGYQGKTTNFTKLSPYGLAGNAPKGSTVLLMLADGQDSLKYGIESDMLKRLNGLKEGECALFNTLTQSVVMLKANGDIFVDTTADIIANGDNVTVTATNVTIAATNIKLSGAIELDGPVSGSGSSAINAINDITHGGVSFGPHVHGGVQTGVGDTGVAK